MIGFLNAMKQPGIGYLQQQLIRTPYNIFQSLIPQNIYLNPDPIIQLSGSKGLAIYQEMMLDPVIASLVNTRMNAILGLDWMVVPANNSEDPDDVMRADFIRNCFDRIALKTHTQDAQLPGFKRFLKAAMDGIYKGYSGIEAVWAIPEGRIAEVIHHVPQTFDFGWEEGPTAAPAQGWWTADTLYYRPDAHGPQTKAPPLKVMMFIYDSLYGSPYGASALKNVYWAWWASFVNGFRYWMTFLDKWANPSVVAHLPQTLLDDDKTVSMMREAAQAFQTDFFAAFLSSPEGKEYVKLMEANRTSSTNAFEQFMNAMNAWKSLGLIGNVLSVMESQFGTRAHAKTHENVRKDYVDADLVTVQDWMQIPIQWMIDVKFGKPEWKVQAEKYGKQIEKKDQLILRSLYPELKFEGQDSEDLNERAKRDQILINMGVPYPVGQALEVYGINAVKIDEETQLPEPILQPVTPPSAGAAMSDEEAAAALAAGSQGDGPTNGKGAGAALMQGSNAAVLMFSETQKRLAKIEAILQKKTSLKPHIKN